MQKTEAFFIRILRPDLNEQTKHRFLHYFDMWAFFKIDFAHTILFSHLLGIRFKKRRFSSQAF